MDRSDEVARRASENRFRQRRAALIGELARLLGPRATPEPVEELEQAVALGVTFQRDHAAAEAHEWARVARWWGADEAGDLADTLHRISNNVGPRPAWLLVREREPQAVEIASDAVLDNPLGFAALAGHELLLLDRQVPAGIWLVRHSHHSPSDIHHRWELEVWGAEPWLSAATRALRGIG